MAKPKAQPVLAYMGPQFEDAAGRLHHEFRAEVCGRVAAVWVPLPRGRTLDEAKRIAIASFAHLEQREMSTYF
jgi:hypothetical protein